MSYGLDYFAPYDLATGDSTMPRRLAQGTSATGNGNLRLTYFTARKAQTVTQIRTMTNSTAQVGATLCRIGVYSEDTSGNLTLIGNVANDTNLWIAALTAYTKTFASSFAVTRGVRYAVGVLVVGSSTAPTLIGAFPAIGSETTLTPRLSAFYASQTDLPSSVTAGSLSDTNQSTYAVLLASGGS